MESGQQLRIPPVRYWSWPNLTPACTSIATPAGIDGLRDHVVSYKLTGTAYRRYDGSNGRNTATAVFFFWLIVVFGQLILLNLFLSLLMANFEESSTSKPGGFIGESDSQIV